jgi:hypothetical protein
MRGASAPQPNRDINFKFNVNVNGSPEVGDVRFKRRASELPLARRLSRRCAVKPAAPITGRRVLAGAAPARCAVTALAPPLAL